MWLFAGLGNPGRQYEKTRHNLGFRAIDHLATDTNWRDQKKALIQKINLAGEDVLLAKPQTYMNLSGESIQPLLAFYKIPIQHLVIFVDDINLDCGRIRVRAKGSHGGQNGLRSIIERLGSDFIRVRIGAGKVPAGWDLSRWVLSKINPQEEESLHQALAKTKDLATCLLRHGLEETMSRYNGA